MSVDKTHKTNAARLLDRAGVKYELVPYPTTGSDLSAAEVARMLGIDPLSIYKTLVLRGDRTGILVCVVPGGDVVDLKKAAAVSDNKSAAMVHMKELLPLTGYIRGGCSPVGMKREYPTYFDSSSLSRDYIFVSAGMRGLLLKVQPRELVVFTNGSVCELTL